MAKSVIVFVAGVKAARTFSTVAAVVSPLSRYQPAKSLSAFVGAAGIVKVVASSAMEIFATALPPSPLLNEIVYVIVSEATGVHFA